MATKKHFKFINSKTGNTIFHYTYTGKVEETCMKAELEKMKAEVATKNGVFLDTIYWEEIIEKGDHLF